MDVSPKQLIRQHYQTLGLDIDSDADLVRGYFYVSLAASCASQAKRPGSYLYKKQLDRYHIPPLNADNTLSVSQEDALLSLVRIFETHGWLSEHRLFFGEMSPYIAEWDSLEACISTATGRAKMLATLSIILTSTESHKQPHDIDIFYTNFRYRAIHTCALTRGELNYILGIEPPTTYARHYCDYSADILQYMMAHKLQRWAKTLPLFTKALYQKAFFEATENGTIIHPQNRNAAVDLTVTASPDTLTSINVEVACEHGFTIEAILTETGGPHERTN